MEVELALGGRLGYAGSFNIPVEGHTGGVEHVKQGIFRRCHDGILAHVVALILFLHDPCFAELDQSPHQVGREGLKARIAVFRPVGIKPESVPLNVQVLHGQVAEFVGSQPGAHGDLVKEAAFDGHNLKKLLDLLRRQRPAVNLWRPVDLAHLPQRVFFEIITVYAPGAKGGDRFQVLRYRPPRAPQLHQAAQMLFDVGETPLQIGQR